MRCQAFDIKFYCVGGRQYSAITTFKATGKELKTVTFTNI